MKIYEIEFISYIFNNFTDFNDSYNKFVAATKNLPDLKILEHRKALLKWLNKWKCRQFALNYHNQVSDHLFKWYVAYENYLPLANKNIWELEESDYDLIVPAYNSLVKIVASKKNRNGKYIEATVGPTGTSKIFFALRPKSLIPLDNPMRQKFKYNGSAASYIKYLKLVKNLALDLDMQCKLNGFEIKELPNKIDRPNSTIPALIDEYHWVTITNDIKIPDKNTIRKWISWEE